jgi:hypothetical protein
MMISLFKSLLCFYKEIDKQQSQTKSKKQPANRLGRFYFCLGGNNMGEQPPSPPCPETEDTGPFEDSEGHPIVEDASLEEQVDGTPNVVESDEDKLGKEEEVLQGTADTVGLTELGSAGQYCFCPDKCLVRLTTKVHGHAILCGHPKDCCRRPKHKQLQGNADRAAVVGIYNATPNATGAVLDAIEDTLGTEDEMERQHQENCQRLDALRGSAQEQTIKTTIRDRSPTQVCFDTNPEQLNNLLPTVTNQLDTGPTSGTPAQPRRNQIQDWISGLTPPIPFPAHNAPEQQPVLPLAQIRPALSPADAVPALLQSLIDKFKGLQEGLEVQQRALAGEAVKADARTTVAVPEGGQCANPTGKGTTSANAIVI